MQNLILNSLSDLDLRNATLLKSEHERTTTSELIEHLVEVEKRMLHLAWGYPNLFEYVVKELKYSESAAYRRIQAARTLRQVPQIASSLKSGELKLSQVAKMQTVINQSEKLFGEKVSLVQQKELLQKLAKKNNRETERILEQGLLMIGDHRPTGPEACHEKHRADGTVEITLKISNESFKQLHQIRDLYSHKNPSANWVDIVKMMMADVIKKRDLNLKKRAKPKIMQSNTAAESGPHRTQKKRSPIPIEIKRKVMQKAHGRCEFRSEDGRICESTFLIEIDHIQPVSLGGGNELKNLRTLCRNHNKYSFLRLNHATDPS